MNVTDFTSSEKQRIGVAKLILKADVAQRITDPMIPDKISELLMNECVLAGGATASVLHNETVNDFDLYFKSMDAMRAFKVLMSPKIVKSIVKDVNPSYYANTTVAGKLVTTNAYTFFNDLQVIILDTVDAITTFDFIHCQPYLDMKLDKFYISPRQYSSIVSKKLVYNPKRVLKDTPRRIEKFKARGWII
jgi:hypothetical protein